jgi:hypothetical protein
MSSLRGRVRTLVERLRKLQAYRADCLAKGHKPQAMDALHLTLDLLDDNSELYILREALLFATQPPAAVPVVLHPVDQARVVTIDEFRLLIERRDAAVVAWTKDGEPHAAACHRTHADLMAAVEVLAAAAVLTDEARTAMGGTS